MGSGLLLKADDQQTNQRLSAPPVCRPAANAETYHLPVFLFLKVLSNFL